MNSNYEMNAEERGFLFQEWNDVNGKYDDFYVKKKRCLYLFLFGAVSLYMQVV